jgi:shikimate kinase
MGSGKSTIGPILANTIGYEFVDLDRAVERLVGKSVNEIFLESGEEQFRALERSLVTELRLRKKLVISLGGGTMVDSDSFSAISNSGIVVYLKSTPEQIYRRVHHREDRPVLRHKDGTRLTDEQLRERIDELYRIREPVYAKADFTIIAGEKKVGITVDEIVRSLSPILR